MQAPSMGLIIREANTASSRLQWRRFQVPPSHFPGTAVNMIISLGISSLVPSLCRPATSYRKWERLAHVAGQKVETIFMERLWHCFVECKRKLSKETKSCHISIIIKDIYKIQQYRWRAVSGNHLAAGLPAYTRLHVAFWLLTDVTSSYDVT